MPSTGSLLQLLRMESPGRNRAMGKDALPEYGGEPSEYEDACIFNGRNHRRKKQP